MTYELSQGEPLARLGRAFADPMRIRILARLAERSMYGQELAEALNVATPTISHHIAILKAAGLVSVERENNYHHYHFDEQGLHNMVQMLTVEHLQKIGQAMRLQNDSTTTAPTETDDRKMTQDAYFKDGRLLNIPSHKKTRKFILERIAESFEWGRIYDEKEVNALLKTFHDDAAALRRDMIEQSIMMRENGRYWLVRPQTPQ
jgi:biotin operon repressor